MSIQDKIICCQPIGWGPLSTSSKASLTLACVFDTTVLGLAAESLLTPPVAVALTTLACCFTSYGCCASTCHDYFRGKQIAALGNDVKKFTSEIDKQVLIVDGLEITIGQAKSFLTEMKALVQQHLTGEASTITDITNITAELSKTLTKYKQSETDLKSLEPLLNGKITNLQEHRQAILDLTRELGSIVKEEEKIDQTEHEDLVATDAALNEAVDANKQTTQLIKNLTSEIDLLSSVIKELRPFVEAINKAKALAEQEMKDDAKLMEQTKAITDKLPDLMADIENSQRKIESLKQETRKAAPHLKALQVAINSIADEHFAGNIKESVKNLHQLFNEFHENLQGLLKLIE